MSRTLALALALALLCSCASYAGLAVAPNGSVWVATNLPGMFGPQPGPVFLCTPRGGELVCSRVPVRDGP